MTPSEKWHDRDSCSIVATMVQLTFYHSASIIDYNRCNFVIHFYNTNVHRLTNISDFLEREKWVLSKTKTLKNPTRRAKIVSTLLFDSENLNLTENLNFASQRGSTLLFETENLNFVMSTRHWRCFLRLKMAISVGDVDVAFRNWKSQFWIVKDVSTLLFETEELKISILCCQTGVGVAFWDWKSQFCVTFCFGRQKNLYFARGLTLLLFCVVKEVKCCLLTLKISILVAILLLETESQFCAIKEVLMLLFETENVNFASQKRCWRCSWTENVNFGLLFAFWDLKSQFCVVKRIDIAFWEWKCHFALSKRCRRCLLRLKTSILRYQSGVDVSFLRLKMSILRCEGGVGVDFWYWKCQF